MQDSNKFTFEELIKNNPEGTERLLKDVMRQKPGVDWERLKLSIVIALCIFVAVVYGLKLFVPQELDKFFSWLAEVL